MLTLTRAVYDGIVEHAREGRPQEVCGVLGGDRAADSVARSRHATQNVADRPRTAYRMDPAEQLSVLEAVETEEEVVGFYHSHPAGPPEPSPTDRARATWPGYCYLIVDLGGETPYVGAWRWTGETFEREAVAVQG